MSIYDGRKIRIPEPRPGYINPAAGQIGVLSYAGWEDWYLIYLDGVYFARERAHTIKDALIPEHDPLLVRLLADILDHIECGHERDINMLARDMIRIRSLEELVEAHRA